MKSFFPVVVIIVLFGAVFIAPWFPTYKAWLETNKALLDSISIIGVVGLIVSLSLTIWHFNSTQENNRKERLEAFSSRLTILETELSVNVHVCTKELLETYMARQGQNALPVPESRFYVSILERTLASGDITDADTRNLLWNLYRSMTVTNSLLSNALKVRNTEHIADPRDQMLISGRRGEVNNLVINATKEAKEAEKLLTGASQKVSSLKKEMNRNA